MSALAHRSLQAADAVTNRALIQFAKQHHVHAELREEEGDVAVFGDVSVLRDDGTRTLETEIAVVRTMDQLRFWLGY
ncbi:MAG: hypothetical protein WAQ08_15900 [Aquabacterium sp.]|uniref:hypothetical protein n=1 Tax=Aquabacterium sp. TaxID=1872578 RepID=UPI003BAF51E0